MISKAGSLSSSLQGLLSESGVITPMFILTGLLMGVFAAVLIVRNFTNTSENNSLGKILLLVILGGMIATTPAFLRVITEESSRLSEAVNNDPPPSPSQTSAPTPTPTTEAPPKEADPIVFPRIENFETVLVVLIGLAVLVALCLIAMRILQKQNEMKRIRDELREDRERAEKAWAVYTDKHAALKKKLLHAETDWDSLFERPALTDPSVPETAAMLRAMREADQLDPSLPLRIKDGDDLGSLPYPRAVLRYETTWERAVVNAKKIGQSAIPAEERKKIRLVRNLLRMAESPGGNPNEREAAYARAQALLKELRHIVLPPAALQAIEQRTLLAIEASPEKKPIAL